MQSLGTRALRRRKALQTRGSSEPFTRARADAGAEPDRAAPAERRVPGRSPGVSEVRRSRQHRERTPMPIATAGEPKRMKRREARHSSGCRSASRHTRCEARVLVFDNWVARLTSTHLDARAFVQSAARRSPAGPRVSSTVHAVTPGSRCVAIHRRADQLGGVARSVVKTTRRDEAGETLRTAAPRL